MKKIIKDIKKFWSYIIYQTKAEIKSEVTESHLGILWLFLEPISFMLIYAFIGEIVFNKTTEYFPIFIFSGLIFWNFFNMVLKKSTKLVKSNKEIISKIYIPKYIFLIICVFINLYKLIITFGLLIIFMLFYGVPISLNVLWTIPIIINMSILTFGISLFFMHYGVIITDLVNITNICLKFMFYLTGIFYSIKDSVPAPYNTIIYSLNPIAFFITEFRNCFIYSTTINLPLFMIWLAIGSTLSIVGLKTIIKHENNYIKVMR
ncbi:MAG: ABC transporter permease [bacterium]